MNSRIPHLWLLVVGQMLLAGCGPYPSQIRNARDIAWTSTDQYALRIHDLPLKDYPKLKRFGKVTAIDFRDTANDAKLLALAEVELPGLRTITMAGSRGVSDRGITALGPRHHPRLATLQLIGTGITDSGLAHLLNLPAFSGVNVERCPAVTYTALRRVFESPRTQSVGFSAENLTADQVRQLLEVAGSVEYIKITDPAGKLNEVMLRAIAQRKGIKLDLRNDSIYPGYLEASKE